MTSEVDKALTEKVRNKNRSKNIRINSSLSLSTKTEIVNLITSNIPRIDTQHIANLMERRIQNNSDEIVQCQLPYLDHIFQYLWESEKLINAWRTQLHYLTSIIIDFLFPFVLFYFIYVRFVLLYFIVQDVRTYVRTNLTHGQKNTIVWMNLVSNNQTFTNLQEISNHNIYYTVEIGRNNLIYEVLV